MKPDDFEDLSKALESVARHVIAGSEPRDTGLGPRYHDYFDRRKLQEELVSELAAHVDRLSGGRFSVQQVERDTVTDFGNMPYSIAFRIVENATQNERFFVLGPFGNGLSYAKRQAEDKVAAGRQQLATEQRRRRLTEEGKKQLDPLAAELAKRLRAKIGTIESGKREDALAILDVQLLRMDEVAGACEAAGIALTSLI